jgi:hypothetical protein
VDHNEEGGLIVTDRNTVCVNAGDIMLAFGAYPAEAPAKILFLHPLYNYAILSYSCKDLPQEVRIFSSAGMTYLTYVSGAVFVTQRQHVPLYCGHALVLLMFLIVQRK